MRASSLEVVHYLVYVRGQLLLTHMSKTLQTTIETYQKSSYISPHCPPPSSLVTHLLIQVVSRKFVQDIMAPMSRTNYLKAT